MDPPRHFTSARERAKSRSRSSPNLQEEGKKKGHTYQPGRWHRESFPLPHGVRKTLPQKRMPSHDGTHTHRGVGSEYVPQALGSVLDGQVDRIHHGARRHIHIPGVPFQNLVAAAHGGHHQGFELTAGVAGAYAQIAAPWTLVILSLGGPNGV